MPRFRRSAGAAALLAALPFTSAQTFSVCNPMQKTDCPTQAGLNAAEFTADFTQGESAAMNFTATTGNMSFTPDGAEFRITQLGDGPTIQSNFMMFFGTVEVVMKAAPGAGIVSSFVMESDDLDEIDWEIIGSDTSRAQSNYFGKGNTTTYDRGQFHTVSAPQTDFHTYAVNWQKDTTTWSIDGQVVRTLNFADAVGGTNYPQTPMNIRLGNWVAGDPKNAPGTIQWAGGLTDFSQGPFSMTVKSIKVTNANPAMSYKYSDQSGTWQSIQVLDVEATAQVKTLVSNSTTGPGAVPFASTVTVDVGGSATGLASNSSSNSGNANAGAAGAGPKSTVTIGLSGQATGSASNSSSNGGNANAGAAGAGPKSTVTVDLSGQATGSASNSSSNGGNANAGAAGAAGAGPKSTVTVDLSGQASGVSNSTSGSSNGGLVGAGAAANGTQATVTIKTGGAGAAAATGGAGASAAGAAGATTFSLTSTASGTAASAARASQFTGNSAAAMPTGLSQAALAGMFGLGLVLL